MRVVLSVSITLPIMSNLDVIVTPSYRKPESGLSDDVFLSDHHLNIQETYSDKSPSLWDLGFGLAFIALKLSAIEFYACLFEQTIMMMWPNLFTWHDSYHHPFTCQASNPSSRRSGIR